ncbi:MAG: MFS transporter [Actinobacteria bacterium]|nr:MFS transporter [Actinomycetota bacterium]
MPGLTRRFPARPVMALGILFTGGGFAMLAAPATLPLLVASMLILTVGEMVAQPVAAGYVSDHAPSALQGRYQGAWAFTYGIAVVVGPAVGTAVHQVSPAMLWLGCGGVAAVAAALTMAGPAGRARSPEPGDVSRTGPGPVA